MNNLSHPHNYSTLDAGARGTALFLSGFSLLNSLVRFLSPQFDANLWWIDVRLLPHALAHALLFVTGAFLFVFAIWPRCAPWRRSLTLASLLVIAAIALVNSAVFWVLLARGSIRALMPVPFSMLVVGASLWIGIVVRKNSEPDARRRLATVGAFALCCLAFPVLQVFCFGHTDYRRQADVAVVFGARTYADGRPSMALADRVRTACGLYHQGLVSRLIFSGGPGDGAVHETEAMRRLAQSLGVPDDVIALDRHGLSTAATIRNTTLALQGTAESRVVAVSEFYHLPRIKLGYHAAGREVYTVPATPSHWARNWPLRSILREVAAFWTYYVRAVGGRLA